MSESLESARARLRSKASEHGINPRDVDVLLSDFLDRPLSYLFAHGEIEVDVAGVEEQVDRRIAGEPLQYIRARAAFYGRDFYVDERVLIPRPETEHLVETAVRLVPRGGRMIDIGAGSGAIAISIALERPDLDVAAVDLSIGALAVSAINCTRLGARVSLAASNLLSAVRGNLDLIVSNPPYIPARDVEELQVEVRAHEPRMALTPGEHGTEIIERILDEAATRLTPTGKLILEIGFGQESAVRQLAVSRKYAVEDLIFDLAGIPRTVVLSRHGQ